MIKSLQMLKRKDSIKLIILCNTIVIIFDIINLFKFSMNFSNDFYVVFIIGIIIGNLGGFVNYVIIFHIMDYLKFTYKIFMIIFIFAVILCSKYFYEIINLWFIADKANNIDISDILIEFTLCFIIYSYIYLSLKAEKSKESLPTKTTP